MKRNGFANNMKTIYCELSGRKLVKSVINVNCKENLSDHFMDLVVCNQLPSEGVDDLIEGVLVYVRSIQIFRPLGYIRSCLFMV